jgi:hypothetical protein
MVFQLPTDANAVKFFGKKTGDGNDAYMPVVIVGADGVTPISSTNRLTVDAQLTGSSLQEQKTEADAVNGVVTFSDVIKHIEIYNKDTVNDGDFTVNGIKITVPEGDVFEAPIGGTPANTVTVTGSASYILGRYA